MGGEAIANADDVSDFDAAADIIESARRRRSAARRRREQRRHPPRPHVRQHDGRGVGRRDPRAPARALLRRAPRGGVLARPVEGRRDRSTRGSINTSSGAGLMGSVGQTAYAAAKAGIAAMTIVPAVELGRYGVTVNGARPERAHAPHRGRVRRHDEGSRHRLRRDGPRQHLAARRVAGQPGVEATSPAACSRSKAARSACATAGSTARRSRRTAAGSRLRSGPAVREMIAKRTPPAPVYGASQPTGGSMKFGLFYELQLPRPWAARRRVQALQEHARRDRARGPARLRLHLGGRAPLPRGVQPLLGARGVARRRAASARSASASGTASCSCRTRSIRPRASPNASPRSTCSPTGASTSAVARRHRSRSSSGSASTGTPSATQWADNLDAVTRMMVEEPFAGWDSKWLTVPPRNVVPKPRQKPHPPLWVACSQPPTIQLAASKGIGALSFAFLDPSQAKEIVDGYYETLTSGDCRAGRASRSTPTSPSCCR